MAKAIERDIRVISPARLAKRGRLVVMRHIVLVVVLASACSSTDPTPVRSPEQRNPAVRNEDSASAVFALQSSKFDDAVRFATRALVKDPRDASAAAVRAISTYRAATNDLIAQLTLVLAQGESLKALDHEQSRRVWLTFVAGLEEVDRDLAIVADNPTFSLELCLACWEYDWNRSGEIEDSDRHMFEVELDGKGGRLAADDARRRPTYHFDVGDAEWARAMIAFQRAAVELVLAYQWSELDKLFSGHAKKIVIRIGDPSRVRRAHTLILAGLEHADRCRTAYLAETDDDREWVPNPRQRSYAMPLEVDAALYETWQGVVGDVREMLESKKGISLREADSAIGHYLDMNIPDAFIDVGAMLREPKDIVLDLAHAESKKAEPFLRGVLGNGYKKSMKPSPIVARLRRMKDELSRGEDSFDRKLRYAFWLN